jgi:hypothetical protein
VRAFWISSTMAPSQLLLPQNNYISQSYCFARPIDILIIVGYYQGMEVDCC